MATETLTLDRERLGMAHSALYEITAISEALRIIVDSDPDADAVDSMIGLAARGMLARVKQLSNAVTQCIDDGTGDADDAEIFETIFCRKQSEVRNG